MITNVLDCQDSVRVRIKHIKYSAAIFEFSCIKSINSFSVIFPSSPESTFDTVCWAFRIKTTNFNVSFRQIDTYFYFQKSSLLYISLIFTHIEVFRSMGGTLPSETETRGWVPQPTLLNSRSYILYFWANLNSLINSRFIMRHNLCHFGKTGPKLFSNELLKF